MKAEQRKELETNTLADKMGHMMKRAKSGERRTYVTYTLIVAAILVAAWLGYRWYFRDVEARSEQWVKFYDGAGGQIQELARLEQSSNVSKAARFQIAWNAYWHRAIKTLATDKVEAMKLMREIENEYGKLAEECKEDANPLFCLQALLGRAVVKETMAVEDRDHLKKAKEYYEAVVEKAGDKDKYAESKFAHERLVILKDEKLSRELGATYQHLQGILDIPQPPPELKAKFPGAKFQ